VRLFYWKSEGGGDAGSLGAVGCGRSVEQMRRYIALRPSGMSQGCHQGEILAPELLPVDVQGGMGDVVAKRLIGVGTTVGARHGCKSSFEDFALLAGDPTVAVNRLAGNGRGACAGTLRTGPAAGGAVETTWGRRRAS